jgi:integrase
VTRGEGRKNRSTGTFGSVDKRATGYRARYTGPDGRRHQAPTLFLTKKDARSWLALRHAEIIRGLWMPPGADEKPPPRVTLRAYADDWLPRRKVKGRLLKDRTREHYRKLLDQHILPTLGALPVASIGREDVDQWYDGLDADTPTLRAHCYGLLKTIMASAVVDEKAKVNPCALKGAGRAERVHKVQYATPDEIAALATEIDERYRAMVLLGAWCALRFGELTALRRRDVDAANAVIRVRRGVIRTKTTGFKVDTPKSGAGVRDVKMPTHVVAAVEQHLDKYVGDNQDDLLFPAEGGGYLAPSTFYRWWYKARDKAGRPDIRFHDLRHSGAVLAAATGATLADLMQRLGHGTHSAALRYQHAAQGADDRIAAGLSAMAGGSDR